MFSQHAAALLIIITCDLSRCCVDFKLKQGTLEFNNQWNSCLFVITVENCVPSSHRNTLSTSFLFETETPYLVMCVPSLLFISHALLYLFFSSKKNAAYESKNAFKAQEFFFDSFIEGISLQKGGSPCRCSYATSAPCGICPVYVL